MARGCLPVPTWPLSQDPACVSTHVLTRVRTYVSPHLSTGCPGGFGFTSFWEGSWGEWEVQGVHSFLGVLSAA